MAKRQSDTPTLEELEIELEEAVAELSAAFGEGGDGDISSLTARVRACEQAISDAYYRRWGSP